ncbi:tetracycline resistance protein [Fusarium heterosporum]|uniref:Tetracycline resistance protein n=1 Tax=Fusarium heterosporum TaxID=42747 RepID=A0A8H5TH02_FUSHE|nr:tetracycline resistance protein [Fusarium heterosporum]
MNPPPRNTPPKIGAHRPTLKTTLTFSSFPKLPVELRLKIWKDACLPRTTTEHGLHYVTIKIVEEDGEDEDFENMVTFDPHLEGYDDEFEVESDDTAYVTLQAMKCYQVPPNKVKANASAHHSNGSAYLWDAGLWTACKESRMAIAEYLDLSGWIKLRNQPVDETLPAWYDKAFPSTLIPHPQDKTWRPIVIPSRDIFCIIPSSVRSLPKSLYSMKLLTPFIATKSFTIRESWAIALKFDSSWNKRFPSDVFKLYRERSPRGLLANWIQGFHDEVYPVPSLWIIDDSVVWVACPGQQFEIIYRDCNGGYVEIKWCATRSDTTSSTKGAVTDFMTSFGILLDDLDEPYIPFETKKIVKLLVRTENQLPAIVEEVSGSNDETEDDTEEDLSDGSGHTSNYCSMNGDESVEEGDS